jgi:N-acetylmuramoyl-L-alanine amidase
VRPRINEPSSPTTSAPTSSSRCTYYYGGGQTASTIGEQLADLALRELVARTGMGNNHLHGKSWRLLRLTRMPAVRVELGYLTSPGDRDRLRDAQFRDTVAEGLLVAVQRLYLPVTDDPPTGVMRIPATLG